MFSRLFEHCKQYLVFSNKSGSMPSFPKLLEAVK
uniref:Uncharacterized protein n=1 Tax=Arundo donax TaxID=35708 RepID=A0A0A9LR06_ARUDO